MCVRHGDRIPILTYGWTRHHRCSGDSFLKTWCRSCLSVSFGSLPKGQLLVWWSNCREAFGLFSFFSRSTCLALMLGFAQLLNMNIVGCVHDRRTLQALSSFLGKKLIGWNCILKRVYSCNNKKCVYICSHNCFSTCFLTNQLINHTEGQIGRAHV